MRKPLTINDMMPFGKHKGFSVGKLLAENPDYACWLREEQKKADPREPTFDVEANDMIDVAIANRRDLGKRYRPWKLGAIEKAKRDLAEAAEKAARDVPKTFATDKISGVQADLVIMDEFSTIVGSKDDLHLLTAITADGTASGSTADGTAYTGGVNSARDFSKFKAKPEPRQSFNYEPSEMQLKEIEEQKRMAKDALVKQKEAVYANDWGAW